MEIVSRPHAENLIRWAKDKPRVLVLSADLTSSCEADGFREAYPERFFSLGMAEQNMIGFAAGLAREGFTPLVHTFSVFLTRRTYDQVAMSIAYPNLPVRLLGFLPGITTPGGVTHQAIDDITLMRALPNLTILECGDATDVETVLDAAQSVDGPVYARLLRGLVPRLFPASEPMHPGRNRLLSTGTDLAVFSSGISTEEAMRALAALAQRGVSATHIHVTCLKPFHAQEVTEAVQRARYGVVSLENHSIVGGLGSAVAEVMAEAGSGKRLLRLGLQDVYAHGASRAYLMREYGLDAQALVSAVETLTGERFGIRSEELARIEIGRPQARAEDL
jgi:transketolase